MTSEARERVEALIREHEQFWRDNGLEPPANQLLMFPVDDVAALLAEPPGPTVEPVAWRVKEPGAGVSLFKTKAAADRFAEDFELEVEPLYTKGRDHG